MRGLVPTFLLALLHHGPYPQCHTSMTFMLNVKHFTGQQALQRPIIYNNAPLVFGYELILAATTDRFNTAAFF